MPRPLRRRPVAMDAATRAQLREEFAGARACSATLFLAALDECDRLEGALAVATAAAARKSA